MISPRSVIGQFLGSPNVSPSLDVLPPGGIQKTSWFQAFLLRDSVPAKTSCRICSACFFTDFEYKFRPWYQISTNKLATRPRQDSWACRSHGGNQVLVVLALCTHKAIGNSISAYICTYKYIQKKHIHVCPSCGKPNDTNSSHLGMVLIVLFLGMIYYWVCRHYFNYPLLLWERHH
jgi:hypothetical protein